MKQRSLLFLRVCFFSVFHFKFDQSIYKFHNNLGLESMQITICKIIIINKKMEQYYLFMVLSSVLWVSSYLYGYQYQLSLSEILMAKGTVLSILSYGMCQYTHKTLQYRQFGETKLFIRNISLIMHELYLLYVHYYLPMHVIHSISSLGLLYLIMFEYLIDLKKLAPRFWLCVVIAILGILMTIVGFQVHRQADQNIGFLWILWISGVYVVILLIWALGVKMTIENNISVEENCFHLGISIVIFSGVAYFWGQTQSSPSTFYLSYIFCGVIWAISLILFLKSLENTSTLVLTISLFSVIVLIGYFYSWIRYSQNVGAISIIGSMITVSGMIRGALKCHQQQKIQNYQIKAAYKFKSKYQQFIFQVGDIAGTLRILFPFLVGIQYPYKTINKGSIGIYERFGKYYKSVESGLQPFNILTDHIQPINIKTQTIVAENMKALTQDNVDIQLNAAVLFHVTDPFKAHYGLEDIEQSIRQLAFGALRSVCGRYTFQDLISQRRIILAAIQEIVQKSVENWGIEVSHILIRDIALNPDMQDIFANINTQLTKSQGKMLNAQAQLETAMLMRQRADILESKAAIQLRWLECVKQLGRNPNINIYILAENDDEENKEIGC